MKCLCIAISSLLTLAATDVRAGDQEMRQAALQNNNTTIRQLEWHYPQDNTRNRNAAAISFEVTNNAPEKAIKSIRFRLMAFDKKGLVLQSEGATLKQLTHTAGIEPGTTKVLKFEKAFLNPSIDSIAVISATVEFMNGSLEMLGR